MNDLRTMQDKTYAYIAEICRQEGFETSYYPGRAEDKLFQGSYRHKHHNRDASLVCAACETDADPVCELALGSSCTQLGCSIQETLSRKRLHDLSQSEPSSRHPRPRVHFGRIASGDMVMKSGSHRDQIAQTETIIAFEMEGAGVWEAFPTVVIKAVCDYADTHKNKIWQQYAAAGAAACSKAFLQECRSADQPLQFPANNTMINLDLTRPSSELPAVNDVMELNPTPQNLKSTSSFGRELRNEPEHSGSPTLYRPSTDQHAEWQTSSSHHSIVTADTTEEQSYVASEAEVQLMNPNNQKETFLDQGSISTGQNPLEKAAVAILSQYGVELNTFGANRVLLWAAKHGYGSVFDFALAQGAKLAVRDKEDRQTPLHVACRYGHHEIVNKLIRLGAIVSATDKYGEVPLHLAARQGCTQCTKALLDEGANTEVVDRAGMTPLLGAVRSGHLESVSLLVDRGANIFVTLKCELLNFFVGDTALHVAAAIGDLATVKFLISRGLGVDTQNTEYDETPLLIAAAFNRVDTIRELIRRGADVQAIKRSGKGVVDLLLSSHLRANGDTEALQILIENGLDVNTLRQSGTALHAATEKLDINAVDMLLRSGARTDMTRTIDQLTPAELAQDRSRLAEEARPKNFSEYSKIAELLANHGSDGG